MMRGQPILATVLLALAAGPAFAKVTRIEAAAPRPMPPVEGRAAYESVTGVFHGELDPRDPANAIITDLDRAPRNAAGMVEYSATFAIARPVDPARRSGVLFYSVPNRGGLEPLASSEDGHVMVMSGWQGDIPPAPNMHYATVPVARGITGTVMTVLTGIAADARSTPIVAGFGRPLPMVAPVSLDTRRARLVIQRDGQRDANVNARDWAFADCRSTPFPGTPDPTQLCLRGAFDPNAAYLLTYDGRDPPVLGIGFAATRDLVAFLRSGQPDAQGTANPAGRGIRWTIGQGHSQSGNFLRSFVHLGFNADEQGARVFDGINPNISGRQVALNLRFGVPSDGGSRYNPGGEGTLWWGRYDDRARRRGASSLLDRCTATNTCPKVFETFGSAELWNSRASPGLVGTDARADIPLPANVRRYYFPSAPHDPSRAGGFPIAGSAAPTACMLAGNANTWTDQLRASLKMLVAWVKDGREPPPSAYPTLARGELVQPTASAMGWPAIPGTPLPDGRINPLPDNDFGPQYRANDASGVLRVPPNQRSPIPLLVAKVNADGNETAGIPSVHLLVPLGTYVGWNVRTSGYGTGTGCGLQGGFIPFARTRAERIANGDPRPSLEERYGNHAGFVRQVLEAIARQQQAGWLLPEDAGRIYEAAENSSVLR